MHEDAIVKKKARVEEIIRALDRLPPSGLIEIKGQLARVSSRSVRQLIEERIHLEQAIAELEAEDARMSSNHDHSVSSQAESGGLSVDDRKYAQMAVEEARKSLAEPDGRVHPRVGAVVVKNGHVLSTAHRGEFPECHAEFIALEKKLAEDQVAGATIYTTLEPCTTRNHPKIPCAARLVERRVARVVIGMLDPDPRITGRGQMALRRARIATDFFPADLMEEVEELNREFVRAQESAVEAKPAARHTEREARPRIFSLHGDSGALLFSGRQHSAHGPFTALSCGVTVVNYAAHPIKLNPLRLELNGKEAESKVFFRPKSDVRQKFARVSIRGNDKEDYELCLMFPDEKIPTNCEGDLWFESDNLQEPFAIFVRFP